jgi:hypothetical protein
METKASTTLQRELERLVVIIAGLAITVAVTIVILWAGWYVGSQIVHYFAAYDS